MSAPPPPRIAVSDRGAARLRAGHPWVYRSDLLTPTPEARFAPIVDRRGRALGWGALHPTATLALRLWHRHDAPITRELIAARLERAVAHREALQRDPDSGLQGATALRLVHAEADALPGLIVERYGPLLVVQNGSAALEPELEWIADWLRERVGAEAALLRADAPARRLEGLSGEARALFGAVPERLEVSDGALRWSVDPWRGQKTGAYLDQRSNQRRFARAVAHHTPHGAVLDVFAHHGGFGLHALAAGAGSATLIDSSASALAGAREAALRNRLSEPELLQGDAFETLRALQREGRRFDAISLDPPPFAKRSRDLERALAGYKELHLSALRLLNPGGLLASASCSAAVVESDLLNVVSEAAADLSSSAPEEPPLRVLARAGAAPDHPERLGFPESAYLKFLLLQRAPAEGPARG